MYTNEINTLNTVETALETAQAEYSEYMSAFDWVFEQDDEALFDIYETIATNKATNLNMAQLSQAKKVAEDNLLNALREFVAVTASKNEQEIINEFLSIGERKLSVRRKAINTAKQMLNVA